VPTDAAHSVVPVLVPAYVTAMVYTPAAHPEVLTPGMLTAPDALVLGVPRLIEDEETLGVSGLGDTLKLTGCEPSHPDAGLLNDAAAVKLDAIANWLGPVYASDVAAVHDVFPVPVFDVPSGHAVSLVSPAPAT